MHEKTSLAIAAETEDEYERFEATVRTLIASLAAQLFETDADPEALWAAYLDNLSPDRRQHYACSCCRQFIQKFGGLAVVGDHGSLTSALWAADFPTFFTASVRAMERLVTSSKITGVFLSSEAVWGKPQTKTWTHLSGTHSSPRKKGIKTDFQEMAEKKEDFGILSHGLADYPKATVEQAVRVLKSDTIYRSEKALGVAEWFLKLHERIEGAKGPVRNNWIWEAVATAPPGFCHVRSTMIATLLDDIQAGLPFDAISRKWAEKMHPLQYQRPTAAPTEGAIEAAEKLVAQLGLEASFGRRYATLEDVLAKVWTPVEQEKRAAKAGGFFAHLRGLKENAGEVELPMVKITWEKFLRTVVPDAMGMEVHVPTGNASFYGLLWAELDGDDDLQVRYLNGDGGEHLGRTGPGIDTAYILTDRLGSVRELVDLGGAVVKSVRYDAFGNIVAESGTADLGNVRFAGYWYDGSTGLYATHWRWYNPENGQWTTEDPLGIGAGDGNFRRYVGNNGLNEADLSGLDPEPDEYDQEVKRVGKLKNAFIYWYSQELNPSPWTLLMGNEPTAEAKHYAECVNNYYDPPFVSGNDFNQCGALVADQLGIKKFNPSIMTKFLHSEKTVFKMNDVNSRQWLLFKAGCIGLCAIRLGCLGGPPQFNSPAAAGARDKSGNILFHKCTTSENTMKTMYKSAQAICNSSQTAVIYAVQTVAKESEFANAKFVLTENEYKYKESLKIVAKYNEFDFLTAMKVKDGASVGFWEHMNTGQTANPKLTVINSKELPPIGGAGYQTTLYFVVVIDNHSKMPLK